VLLFFALLGWGAAAFGQPGTKPDLARAQGLMRDGKAEEAWQLLVPHEARHAGSPDFDYPLALAALESGRAGRASFILERILAVQPGHLAARLALARSYRALRDHERARLLSGVDAPAWTSGLRLGGYVELAAGHDTNVSAAMAQASVFLPGLGAEFVPDPRFARRADGFGAVAAGIEVAGTLTERHAVFGGADLRQRVHEDVEALDARNLDLRAGVQSGLGARDQLRFTFSQQHDELDYAGYRRVRGMALEWSRPQGRDERFAITAQGQRIRYLQPDLAASSSDLIAVAATGAWLLDHASGKLVVASAYVGHDNATSGRGDGDRHLAGLSFGVQRRLGGVDAYASAAVLYSDYQAMNPDFAATRRDRQTDLALGLTWPLAEHWSLRPQLAHTRNRSNIQLNDYKRTEASLALRYSWN
jgi:hypothetical protein